MSTSFSTNSPAGGPDAPKVLLIGYGNPGRLDDGLGPELAAAVARRRLPLVTVESNYQLSVEDAAQIAEHDAVIFADAHVSCADPFVFQALAPRRQESFTSHSVMPDAVLGLAHDVFGGSALGYLLGIRGHAFNEFEERLSEPATENLEAAIGFIVALLEAGDLAALAAAAEAHGGACTTMGEPPTIVAELARTAADGATPPDRN